MAENTSLTRYTRGAFITWQNVWAILLKLYLCPWGFWQELNCRVVVKWRPDFWLESRYFQFGLHSGPTRKLLSWSWRNLFDASGNGTSLPGRMGHDIYNCLWGGSEWHANAFLRRLCNAQRLPLVPPKSSQRRRLKSYNLIRFFMCLGETQRRFRYVFPCFQLFCLYWETRVRLDIIPRPYNKKFTPSIASKYLTWIEIVVSSYRFV